MGKCILMCISVQVSVDGSSASQSSTVTRSLCIMYAVRSSRIKCCCACEWLADLPHKTEKSCWLCILSSHAPAQSCPSSWEAWGWQTRTAHTQHCQQQHAWARLQIRQSWCPGRSSCRQDRSFHRCGRDRGKSHQPAEQRCKLEL